MKKLMGARGKAFLPLCLLLLVAAGLRLLGVDHGLPHGYYPDETHFLKRSLAFGSFDFNPHWFHKPAFFMYILFFEFGIYFVIGKLVGAFSSSQEFAAEFLTNPTTFYLIGRITNVVFGVLSILVASRMARKMGGHVAGLVAALFLAATVAQASSCQSVKADVPSSLLTLISLFFLSRAAERNHVRDYLLCGLIAGLSMATKYYAIFLLVPLWVVGFVVCVRGPRVGSLGYSAFVTRSAIHTYCVLMLASGLFVLGFFLASPYNFLDPLWYEVNLRPIIKARTEHFKPILRMCDLYLGARFSRTNISLFLLVTGLGYGAFAGLRGLLLSLSNSPRSRNTIRSLALVILLSALFVPMLIWDRYFGSAVALVTVLLSKEGMGPILGSWGLLSVFMLILRRDRFSLLIITALVSFVVMANVYMPNFAEPRHLNNLYPLLAIAGALFFSDLLTRFSVSGKVAIVVAGALAAPGVWTILQNDLVLLRKDTRSEALEWVEANIPSGTRILNDKDWVKTFPSAERVRDIKRSVVKYSESTGFMTHRSTYLDLLEFSAPRYDGPTYYSLTLDPPWWADRERDTGYGSTTADLDMGNPMAHRIPYSLPEYSRRGYEYVITTSKTFRQYTREPWRSNWPSLASFYDELLKLEPIYTLRAEPSRRSGPEVRVYALRKGGSL